jgi:hypothetical protein
MAVKDTELADFISATLNDLPDQYFEVAWTNQDYEGTRIFNSESMQVDGGNQIERKVMLSTTGNARYRRNFDVDDPQISDTIHTIKVPWTRLSTNYSWDELELIRQGKQGATQIISLLKTRRIDGLWDLADLIEERFWKTPTSATDDLYPYGIPYYINPMDSGATTDGFVGKTIQYQGGTNGTTCANINANTYDKWRNYAAIYSAVDNAMLKKFRIAFAKCNFKAPTNLTDPGQVRTAQKRIYCDWDVWADMCDLADAKDDNHRGKDILGNIRVDDGGTVLVNRLQVVPIPQLDGFTWSSSAIAPIFCVDFKYIIPIVQDGYWMREKSPMVDRGQHTTFTVFLDGSHCILCTNRRRLGFVLHLAY